MTLRTTEPEVGADLAGELDRYIQQGGTPFQKATVQHSAGGLFPDIVIWIDYAAHKAFAIWELKAPGLREDLSKLVERAKRLGVRYAVAWNFQSGELYEIESRQLWPRKSYPAPLLNSLGEWAIVSKRIAVVEQARKILDDLAYLAQGRSLMPYVPDRLYFTSILQKAIHSLTPVLQEHLFSCKKDRNIRARLEAWAVKQGYPIDLSNLDELLARHWAYSLAVRLLFYFTVRRYYPSLPELKPGSGAAGRLADSLWDAFSKAQTVDWQAVFERSPLDDLGLPPQAEPILEELLSGFHRYDFSQLKEDVIGQIMEGLIPEEERHALGQYFTREDLVDFIIGFVADKDSAYYLDPTCGSGTFLNRLYSRLRWLSGYRAAHAQLIERLWGVDIAHFPAELATVNLFRQDVTDLTNFPRIVVRDFFDIRPAQDFEFPPLKATTPDYQKIRVTSPAFHGIVGNFPYIRQELIERQVKGYKRQIVQAIAREWFWRDQSLFHVKGIPRQELERQREQPGEQRAKWVEQQVQAGRVDLRLSGQADIYTYLFYHAAAFLEEGGRIGIVTSNAWLDVAYGEELKRFFLRHFKVVAVVASWAEPWFQDPAINTAFTILERCEDGEQRRSNIVRFVKVKKPLSEILPRDLLLREAERWQKVDTLVRQIEAADARVTQWDRVTGATQPIHGVLTVETDAFRIRMVRQEELEAELERKGETAKWGLYIRAPQVYFDLLEAAGDKLVPLSHVADVRFGVKTGINDFFYLQPVGEPASNPGALRVKNARGWVGEIEETCLRPVIKSPREAKGLVVTPSALRYRLFLPPVGAEAHPERALRRSYPLAWRYVEWGAQQRTREGQPWPQVPSVQGRKAWWLLDEKTPGPILMPMTTAERFAIFDNRDMAFVDHRLFEFLVQSAEGEFCIAVMNSTVFALLREVVSRVNFGDGAAGLDGVDWKHSVLTADPSQFTSEQKRRVISVYNALRARAVRPISQDVKQKDRRALDVAVMEALGLDPDTYLPRIYEALVEIVQERLTLPKLRATGQKREKRLSLEELKTQVQKEILPGGLKPIVSFLPLGLKLPTINVEVSARPVSWQAFLSQFTILDATGAVVGVLTGDEYQVRYAIYVAQPGQYLLEIPADPVVASKAVQEYEQYLRETGQALYNRALDVTRDHRQAERITREILESLGLPPLAVAKAMGG